MSGVKTSQLVTLQVRPIHREEIPRWKELMEAHHYLGYRHLIGTSICYVAILKGQWVALLSWAWAALKSRHRDKWIGWDESLKNKRLRYIVNNTRFLILPGIRIKNLASKILSLNVKRLSDDWMEAYKHPIVLVETFVDDARFLGTCYKAAGWTALGQTRGYGKKNTHYIYHGETKTIYVKALHPRAQEMLRASFLDSYLTRGKQKGALMDIEQLPLKGQGGLIDFLGQVSDPRKARGIRHTKVSLLALSICASLSGAVTYESIAQWGKSLTKEALRTLGFRRGLPPSEPAIRRFLQQVDPVELDNLISKWIMRRLNEGAISSIAIDGKTLRGSYDGEQKALHLLSAIVHKQGVVVGQRTVGPKTNEIKVTKPLLKKLPLEKAVVTLDAMHTQKETAQYLVENKRADYLMTVKGNQATLKDHIQSLNDEDFSPSIQ